MAAVLLIPFLSLRFGVLSMLDSSALRRAAHFPPFRGPEKPAYWLYQLSSAALLLGPFFASVHTAPAPLFWSGAALYAFGLLLLLLSVISFAAPSESGVRQGRLPYLPQSHVCLLFFVFWASSSPSRFRSGRPSRLSAHRPHRHPGRGALVPPDLRRGLRALLRLGQTTYK
ncbi:MAG: hypothetical protein ACLS63_04085 [Flavonifractor plautii]